jgi:dTDP-4-dehydrorhamnose 3,5-epimerase
MQVQTTELDGVLLVQPPTIFEDFRGAYVETYNERLYRDNGIDVTFVQDDTSLSSRHVCVQAHFNDSAILRVLEAEAASRGHGKP